MEATSTFVKSASPTVWKESVLHVHVNGTHVRVYTCTQYKVEHTGIKGGFQFIDGPGTAVDPVQALLTETCRHIKTT